METIGGGAFGNDDGWVDSAIERAFSNGAAAGLDVRLVSYGKVYPSNEAIAERW